MSWFSSKKTVIRKTSGPTKTPSHFIPSTISPTTGRELTDEEERKLDGVFDSADKAMNKAGEALDEVFSEVAEVGDLVREAVEEISLSPEDLGEEHEEVSMPPLSVRFRRDDIRAAIRFWLRAKLPEPISSKACTATVEFMDEDDEEAELDSIVATINMT